MGTDRSGFFASAFNVNAARGNFQNCLGCRGVSSFLLNQPPSESECKDAGSEAIEVFWSGGEMREMIDVEARRVAMGFRTSVVEGSAICQRVQRRSD